MLSSTFNNSRAVHHGTQTKKKCCDGAVANDADKDVKGPQPQ